ncbi:zona pellucida-like domain-containing protein 1 isoform X2 [Notolabrus celidotus]|uniref:zona pellucida-like domain-containing protein 1 isoform X2 n=1 Tax=Notolabrus celidotus TaxID=1203425 RepID=UPI00148FA105|nr:zona pellucida-like domain-containing protein 1 isoform X2 [Notolabrus celidotus]XP_034556624.1 zona pellucida-like domain-containing protein 1 isoform X2 [Notolabrus celidotus]XP_034556625.1 zona pellucida-like domain-containing protein 1 isoform X2 [Notolabrus celidotus]
MCRTRSTKRSTLRTMRLVILLCLLVLIVRTEAQIPDPCITSDTNRAPENSDIFVTCGSDHMDLAIYICPMYQALYNESLMALNSQYDTPECYGTADWTVDPPVLRFSFPLNTSAVSSCGNNMKITNELGTGAFADFSNVQFANISGIVTSRDPSLGMITYRPQILYKFSCLYPMQYLLNNTQLAVSGVNLAINDNNGSFISTLGMKLFEDENQQTPLSVPASGLNLKTKIYVSVKATNLTERFNVLLDRCYATTIPFPMSNRSYDLFVGCNRDEQTQVILNGVSQIASFSFEAFRFVEHRNLTVSTFYVHCVTRLCDVSSCVALKPDCSQSGKRRKREAEDVSDSTTVSSTAIRVGKISNGDAQTFSASYGTSPESGYSSPVVAVIVCIVILSILFVAMAAYFMFYIRRRKPIIQ